MALKGKEHFYGFCYTQVKKVTPLAHLADNVLTAGLIGAQNTRGHQTQAIGAVQCFLAAFPNHGKAIRSASPTEPFDLGSHPSILAAWKKWLKSHTPGPYGQARFGYNISTLEGLLTVTLGGTRKGGGGGDDEFKKVLRLAAHLPM